ncbi:MAG: S-layer homology domain-containing protein, partial [Clostridia bacterium]|nr:S-layer homology domain-containing protein [Clostridia bacterium]
NSKTSMIVLHSIAFVGGVLLLVWGIYRIIKGSKGGYLKKLQNDYTSSITRAEFARSIVQLCLTYYNAADIGSLMQIYGETHDLRTGAEFTDILLHPYSAEIDCAYRLGIINGISDTTFDPDSLITREAAAVMLYRAYMVCGGESVVSDEIVYTDTEEIADWAVSEVQQMSGQNVVRGMGDGTFAPKSTYTREQCYLTLLRLFNLLEVVTTESESIQPENTDVSYTAADTEAEEIITNYFIYEITSENTLKATDYIGPKGIIIMQPVLDGYTVSSIGSGAFDGYSGLQVCVPDSVNVLEADAFPSDIGAVYYESEASTLKSYAEENNLNSALWVWKDIGYIPWYKPQPGEKGEIGAPKNSAIAKEATTQIFCERSPEEGFEYTIDNDIVTVTGYHGEYDYVSIPETIEGYPVRVIGMGAFFLDSFEHLEIPKTVTEVQSYVCGMQSGVSTVHILDGEDCTLGYNVFCGNSNHVRLHNNVKEKGVGERNPEYELASGKSISMYGCIVPESYEEENGFRITIFTYPEE